jgi:RNA polymerase sigma factor (sigma-70 family)
LSPADEIFYTHIEPIQKQMMAAIYRIVQDPDDAADAFQNALFKIWNYLDRIITHPNPQGYIINICTCSAYDILKIRYRQRFHERPIDLHTAIPSNEASPYSRSREIITIIQQAIASLPLQQAQAVLLRLFEEESFLAIGVLIGCSEATARSHFSKGLSRLRAILSDLNISPAEVNS